MKKIVVKQSSIHCRGVFALADISKGERVVQYTGRRLTKAQSSRSKSNYLFELNKRCDIDGRNIARYINHSCDPNCEVDVTRGQIWISALRNIRKGEELSYNYSYNLEESVDYPCNCGSERCVGYILAEKYWKKAPRRKK